MKPYVVSLLARPPHPTREGGAIRNYHLLAGLTSEFTVRALSLMPPGADELPWQFPPGVEHTLVALPNSIPRTVGTVGRTILGEPLTVAKYRSSALRLALREMLSAAPPAWVVAHSYHMAKAALGSGSRAWVDFHNVESAIWRRMSETASSPVLRLATAWQTPLVERLEKSVLKSAQGCSCVSELDASAMRTGVPGSNPIVVPNGVDLCRYDFRPAPAIDPVLLFVGDLRWRPNSEGVAWFRAEVWPLLRERARDVRVEILGRGAGTALLRTQEERFIFLGDHEDTRPFWARASIAIVPLRAGGGTRLKILEAAAMGVPVVSTTVGAEGLSLVRDEDLLVRDDPGHWVDAIVALLGDRERRRTMAVRARTRVARGYDWRTIGREFAQHLAQRLA